MSSSSIVEHTSSNTSPIHANATTIPQQIENEPAQDTSAAKPGRFLNNFAPRVPFTCKRREPEETKELVSTPKAKENPADNLQVTAEQSTADKSKGSVGQMNDLNMDSKVNTDDEDLAVVKDFRLNIDEFPRVLSTKDTEKDSVNTSFEREELSIMGPIEEVQQKMDSDRSMLEKLLQKDREPVVQYQKPIAKHNLNNILKGIKVTKPQTARVRPTYQTTAANMSLNETKVIGNNKNKVIKKDMPVNDNGSFETASREQSFVNYKEKGGYEEGFSINTTYNHLNRSKILDHKKKSKINLEVFMMIEDHLRFTKEALVTGDSVFEAINKYMELGAKKDEDNFELIFKIEYEVNITKSAFILERMAMSLILYFVSTVSLDNKTSGLLREIANIVHQNCIVFGYFISLKLRDRSGDNAWIEKLFNVIEMEEIVEMSKPEGFDTMARNNEKLKVLMKSLIMTLKNKEIMYVYNSIVLQMNKLTIKEASIRLLKALSLHINEKEWKAEAVKYKLIGKKAAGIKEKPKVVKGSKLNDLRTEISEEIATCQTINEEIQYYLPYYTANNKKYTLVLDLDETLVHYAEIPGHYNELRVRPYVEHFLTEVSKHFEIVIFTTGLPDYADWVLDNIDKNSSVSFRLYRNHATVHPETLSFTKDLARLGRDLSKVLIVDNLPDNFSLQPDNGIAIKSWYDDPEDNALFELAPLLIDIVKRDVPDVREALRIFREQMMENMQKGYDNPHLNLHLD